MMNIEQFRQDYKEARERVGITQQEIESTYNVPQASISRLETSSAGLSFDNIVRLWPFVYGTEFPYPKEASNESSANS